MTDKGYRLTLRHRALFYTAGFVFATFSYMAGIWAYGMESADWGDTHLYEALVGNLQVAFRHHMLTFFVWELVCVGIAAFIAHLFDQEVYYRRKAEKKANNDGLTDIYNHRYFQERLSSEVERAIRYNRDLSVIMLDLDNFKAFNDTWGHQEGDKLLRWFAKLCTSNVRNIDILARYGGEEFIIILPETQSSEALAVAERIRASTEKLSANSFGRNKRVTVSAGVASFPTHGKTRHALVLNADAALYYSKQEGKNCCFVYEEKCHRSYRVQPDHVRPLLTSGDLEAMEALGAMVDSRDSHARGHSLSVMQMSVALGQKLGMATEEIDNLRAAALLHDIGTVMTPEDILAKPGPLAEDERKKLQDHVGLGSQFLKRVQQMRSLVSGVQHHHERYDGTGYPNGLSGKDIPLLARIIAIADSYDAMINARAYKSPVSVDEAVAELKRCAGSQFDPDLVETFANIIQHQKNSEAA